MTAYNIVKLNKSRFFTPFHRVWLRCMEMRNIQLSPKHNKTQMAIKIKIELTSIIMMITAHNGNNHKTKTNNTTHLTAFFSFFLSLVRLISLRFISE